MQFFQYESAPTEKQNKLHKVDLSICPYRFGQCLVLQSISFSFPLQIFISLT